MASHKYQVGQNIRFRPNRIVRDEAQIIAEHLKDFSVTRVTQASSRLDKRIEHPLHIEGRPADDLQNVRGSCLLFEGLLKLAFARLLGVKQPRILDSYHGLSGEGLEQPHLLI